MCLYFLFYSLVILYFGAFFLFIVKTFLFISSAFTRGGGGEGVTDTEDLLPIDIKKL